MAKDQRGQIAKKLIAMAALICAALPACAQTVPVSASLLQDGKTLACAASGNHCTIYWTPVLASSVPTVYRKPGGGMATVTPVSAPVSNGAFSIPSMPDSMLFWACSGGRPVGHPGGDFGAVFYPRKRRRL